MTFYGGPAFDGPANVWQSPPPGWWQAYDGRWYPPAVAKKATVGRIGDTATVAFNYDQRFIQGLKRLGIGAQRDPDLNCWVFPFDALRLVLGLLDAEGYLTCFETDLHLEMVRERRSTWAVDVLRTVPPHLRRSVYTALARVLHPDVGGDAALMQALNDAWHRLESGDEEAGETRETTRETAGPRGATH